MSEEKTGLARVAETGVATTVALNGWGAVWSVSEALAKAPLGIVPKSYQGNPSAIAACILTGAELQLGPMESLRSIYIVEGKPQLAAELMLRLAMRAGVRIEWLEKNDRAVKARFTRAGYPSHEEAFTMADAERMGVAGRDTWKRYPRNMMSARCVSNALRSWAPDVLGAGVYAEGEIVEGTAEEVKPATIAVTVESKPLVVNPSPMERLKACASPTDLEAWCDAYAKQVTAYAPRVRLAVEKGATLGVLELVVRKWLGLPVETADGPPRELDDGSLSDDPPKAA